MVDPQLTVDSQPIPFIGSKPIKFLGMNVPFDASAAKQELKTKLKYLLQAVADQKLKLFKLGVCPGMNWLLTIYEYPLTWIERELDSMVTKVSEEVGGPSQVSQH